MTKKRELYDFFCNFKTFKLVGISSQTTQLSQENIFSRIRCPPLPPLVIKDKKEEIIIKGNSIKFKGEGSVKISKELEEGIWILFCFDKIFYFVCFRSGKIIFKKENKRSNDDHISFTISFYIYIF
jgi:hypothetical protein